MAEKRPKMKRPAAVGDLLDHIFQDKPAGKRLHEGRIWLVWDKAVGDKIAVRAQPAGFRDGILTVCVDNAPWMQQLTYLKREIIAKVNEMIGEDLVRDLYLKAGTNPLVNNLSTSPPPRSRSLSPAETTWIHETAAAISDPELQQAIARLMGKHLEKN